MSETLSERLDAVERALTDDETDVTDVRERAALSAEVDRLDARLDDVEAQLEELDAAVEAVRGYAGNLRAVNRDVERRASAALAKAEALETALDPEDGSGTTDRRSIPTAASTGVEHAEGSVGTDSGEADARPSTDSGRSGEKVGSATADTNRRENPKPGRDAPTVPTGSTARPSSDVAGDGDREDGDAGTEQFIERVRDAL